MYNLFSLLAEITEEDGNTTTPMGSHEDSLMVIRTKQLISSKGRIEEQEAIVMSPTGTPDNPFLNDGASPVHEPVLKRSGRVLSSSSKDDLLKGLDKEKIERMRSPSPRLGHSNSASSSPSTSLLEVHHELVEEIAEAMQDDLNSVSSTVTETATTEKKAFDTTEGGDVIVAKDTLEEITTNENKDNKTSNEGKVTDEENKNTLAGVHNNSNDDDDFELTSHNLVRLSSTGGAARQKVKNFVESMINDNDNDKDNDNLPDMNQVSVQTISFCTSTLLFKLLYFLSIQFHRNNSSNYGKVFSLSSANKILHKNKPSTNPSPNVERFSYKSVTWLKKDR